MVYSFFYFHILGKFVNETMDGLTEYPTTINYSFVLHGSNRRMTFNSYKTHCKYNEPDGYVERGMGTWYGGI